MLKLDLMRVKYKNYSNMSTVFLVYLCLISSTKIVDPLIGRGCVTVMSFAILSSSTWEVLNKENLTGPSEELSSYLA